MTTPQKQQPPLQQKIKAPRSLKKKARGATLSPLEFSHSQFQQKLAKNLIAIGADEVGAGCLAGPLVVSAFSYKLSAPWCQIDPQPQRVYDSKKLSAGQRKKSRSHLEGLDDSFIYTLEVEPEKIDQLNIYQARMWALAQAATRCIEYWQKHEPDSQFWICIDGPKIPQDLESFLGESCLLEAQSKGDSKFFSVAAASIIAKDYRDQLMEDLSADFPDYGWASNVGYPTPDHKAACARVGLSPHHRRSFSCMP